MDTEQNITAEVNEQEMVGNEVQPNEGAAADTTETTMDDVFTFTDADAEGADVPDVTPEETVTDTTFDLGEQTAIPQTMHAGLAARAQELGLDGAKAAQYLNAAMAYAKEVDQQVAKESGAALRQEWGSAFNDNVAATKSFMARMSKKAGLTTDQMQVLMSPNGFRLMNAIRVASGGESSRYAGTPQNTPKLSAEQELEEIYADPQKYHALINPGDPMHRIVNRRVNQLLGIE